MDALTPVIVGALLAAGAGLLGAFIQGRREHKKWLRERRLDAYLPAIAFLTEYELLRAGMADHRSRVDGVIRRVSAEEEAELLAALRPDEEHLDALRAKEDEILTPLILLGPESVSEAALAWRLAADTSSGNRADFAKAFPPVVRAMKDALRIPD